MSRYFDLLFARPSFLEGIARLMDFGSTMNEYNDSPTPSEADLKALRSDWRAVGVDIVTASEHGRDLIPTKS